MITLLDASVLIALGDAGHVHEKAALRFFEKEAIAGGWATCPMTEIAFLRILSHPSYPRTLGTRRNRGGFWPDCWPVPVTNSGRTTFPSPTAVSIRFCRRPSISPTTTSWRSP